MDANDIIDFWFKKTKPEQWFTVDESFDRLLCDQFLFVHDEASRGELFRWRRTAEGRLAEIIVLDQFSRNIFRNTPKAFTQDPMALILAEEMVEQKLDEKLSPEWRAFAYLPYMHSESLVIHQEALKLFTQKGLEENLRYERLHYEILKRFGRFPHRNKILGRTSTMEEMEFLKTPGSSF